MEISANLLKLVTIVATMALMALVILRPGEGSVTDAVTHTFAMLMGVLVHGILGDKKKEE